MTETAQETTVDTTEETTTPDAENAPDEIGAGSVVPGQGNDTGDSQNGTQTDKRTAGLVEARDRYKAERDSSREALSVAEARIAQLQTRELERIASKSLSNPADLLTLSGKSLADFVGEDGELDADLITETANEVLGSRPGLRPRVPAYDPTRFPGGVPGRGAPVGWEVLGKF